VFGDQPAHEPHRRPSKPQLKRGKCAATAIFALQQFVTLEWGTRFRDALPIRRFVRQAGSENPITPYSADGRAHRTGIAVRQTATFHLGDQYILSERVRRAKEPLSKCDLSISDVALAAGFHNAYQMNRVFRKIVGLTPTALRRQTGLVSR
jgi:AraC-like DNA-binding protein